MNTATLLMLTGMACILVVVFLNLSTVSNAALIQSSEAALTAPALTTLPSSTERIEIAKLKQQIAQLEAKLEECQSAALNSTHMEEALAVEDPPEKPAATTQHQTGADTNDHTALDAAERMAYPYREISLFDAKVSNSKNLRSNYCALVPDRPALTIWNDNLWKITDASKHHLDHRYKFHDFTAALLHLLSPDRIQRSVTTLPLNWKPVQRVMQQLYERREFLKLPLDERPPTPARRVKILVMGGSLIVGVNCRKIAKDLDLHIQMPNRLCTWTHRLEFLVNNLLGGDYIEVHKIALGGTNTNTGYVMWDSDFIPEETKNPDILINAYSTNDMHILTVLEAQEGNQTLRDKVMEMTQDFVRAVMKEGDCAPLLLHMDDYLGNEQRSILTTTEMSQAVQVLANYYGFASMSFANAVRDLVYADTKEGWISPVGWYEGDLKKLGDEMVREIHPGMGMHIMTSWVAAYYMLNLGITYCSIEGFLNETKVVDETEERPYEFMFGLPYKKDTAIVPYKPHGRPRGLPPLLTASLSLENVTALWKQSKPPICIGKSTGATEDKCPFSWFSGLSKQGLNETIATAMFTKHYVTKNTGWVANEGGKKLGISPDNGKELDFAFPMPVSTLTLFYMKSYGKKWDASKVAIRISQGKNELVREDLVGYHDKNTSETYTHRMDFEGKADAGDYQVSFELVGGSTFKIMGLAICKF